MKISRGKKGLSLISTLIGVAIFTMVGMAAYSAMLALTRGEQAYRAQTVIASLADQYMEIVRNMPYSGIGTINGNPSGTLPDQPNAASVTVNNVTYQMYYVVNYVDDPADGTALLGTDPAPDDYKQVKLYIKNTTSGELDSFVTSVAPKGLEGLASGGALSLKVFNAVGEPVPNATIQIVNTSVSPAINLTRTTDASGNWTEVGLPDSVTSYHVVATKTGYSSGQTYPSTLANPNPTKPDATISNGQITQISFSIDQESSLQFNTVNETCQPLSGVGLELRGSKLIGTPDVLKFDSDYTSDAEGHILIPLLEWDNYTPAITSAAYMVYGSSPIQQINVLPDTDQQSTLMLGPTTANSLLVIVKDAANGNALEGATVTLQNVGDSYTATKFTQGSIWTQQDWSGGAGQSDFTVQNEYAQDDGNVDVSTLPTGLRLVTSANGYVSSGTLESSAFDTGTASTSYTTLTWEPTSQTASTSVEFQIATNNDDATWNYLGPDGTPYTYYTTPGTSMNATTTNDRYVRYKVFLSSTSTTTTPVLSSVNLNYVSGCAAPGQVMFAGLSGGDGYQVMVSMPGYTTQTIPSETINGYNLLQVSL